MSYRAGIDVGGTFTDCVLLDETSGRTSVAKVPSTPRSPGEGLLAALAKACSGPGIGLDEVKRVLHGTTVLTNALLEGKVARVALVTTGGFRDVLAIGTQLRPDNYDLFQSKPAPLVPRRLRFAVEERVGPKGEVLTPLRAAEIEKVVDEVARSGAEAVAVVLLFSFLRPAHEQILGEALSRKIGTSAVSLSSEVCPEIREFHRTSTTVLHAALGPLAHRYVKDLERALGSGSELLLLQSSGGLLPSREASRLPHHLLYSGPAGGAVAAAHLARLAGPRDILTLDMGGTSADASLIERGQPRLKTETEVAGYPVLTPVLDIRATGAGGGSIARVDKAGALRVGPESAGAEPGPACYGQGGTEPTLTDANLLLGRLPEDGLLGGEKPLLRERAEEAVASRVARPLGLSLVEVASGIIEIAVSNMVRVLRVLSVGRGIDPARLVLVAFGGAGPLHACRVAEELGVRRILIPPHPGLTSALGLLLGEIRFDFSLTHLAPAEGIDGPELESGFQALEARAAERLAAEGGFYRRALGMRYRGQGHELVVPLDAGHSKAADSLREALSSFHRIHEETYGHAAPAEPVEIVTLRLTAVSPSSPLHLEPEPLGPGSRYREALSGTRPVYLRERGDFTVMPVLKGEALLPGASFAGPALVGSADSVVLLGPRWSAKMDPYRNLILEEVASA